MRCKYIVLKYNTKINSTKISCIRIYLTFVYTFVRYNVVCLYYNLKRYNMELRIKDVLKEKKVTVVSLAGMIGITQPNMSNIVNGKSTPSLETLERIANALEVDITELFVPSSSGGIIGVIRIRDINYNINSVPDLSRLLDRIESGEIVL